jgi:CheY-like chemotaxis protein
MSRVQSIPPAEPQRDAPLHAVTVRTQMSETFLAFRALIEQVRLALRDGRRLVRQLIALCATSKRASRVQSTSDPVPLVLVPLVVLASATEREEVELDNLVQSLSAEGYETAHRGHHWTVYTAIPDRRNSVSRRLRTREQRRSVSRLEANRCEDDGAEPARPGFCPSSTVMRGPQTVNARKHPGSQTATVLIVDDDPATVDTFAQVLRLEGYDVRTALSAEDGMRAVDESAPDVIFLDYNMPVANGAEFLRRLRACEGHCDTPVAVVTGDYTLDDAPGTELHQLGARLVFKPLFVTELVDLTTRLLVGRRSGLGMRPPTDTGEQHRMHL